MAIHVTCPGCHASFKVSDQFAGKEGPCPKCKKTITIPSRDEEVKVHAPEQFGPKGQGGQAVLKPIFREDAKFSPLMAGGIAVGVLGVLVIALMLRFSIEDKSEFPVFILACSAIFLAPPICYGGYMAMRGDDLAPHQGKDLWIRIGACSVAYAALWAVLAVVDSYVFEGEGISTEILFVVIPLMVVGGAGAAVVAFDLEFFNGLFHYGFYLLVTVLLRVIVGIPAFPYES